MKTRIVGPLMLVISMWWVFPLAEVRAQGTAITLISTGAVWRYLDTGVDQGTAWSMPGFNDSSWRSGPAQLGYGDGDEATLVSFGNDPANRYITTYFRRSFQVNTPAVISSLTLGLLRDDGGVVYLNGVEVFRSNMPTGAIVFATLASAAIAGAGETTYFQTSAPPALLIAGANVIAVEIHQATPGSSDLSFDFFLTATQTTVLPPIITAQPVGRTVPCGSNVVFSVSASGTPPLNYQWSFNGANIPGATSSSLTVANAGCPDAGFYSVRVSNAAGATNSQPATLTVTDTVAPTLGACPPNRSFWTCGTGVVVNFTPPTATDNCAGPVPVTCSRQSGSVFPIGVTTVTCTATDVCGNTRSCSFTVTVTNDTNAPVLVNCPSNRTVTTCTAGAVVNFTPPTATDDCDPSVTVTCTRASGSVFPVGTTTVTCTATDDCGNSRSCAFDVTVVRDPTPPDIFCPTGIVVIATSAEGADVPFNVTATDNCSSNVTVVCTPPPGPFPVGTTTVNCTATDNNGNSRSCHFDVTVLRPPLIIDEVSPLVVAAGDLIRVRGSGFGDDPNNLCCVIRNGARLIPMRVRTATDTELTVEVGPISADAKAGPVCLARGTGGEGPFDPTLPTLDVREQAWVFMAREDGVCSRQFVEPVPTPSPQPQTTWYHSAPASTGSVCITLPSPCPPNTRLAIDGHLDIVGTTGGVRHVDMWLPTILWLPGGTPLDLADAVCDAVASAFFQQFGVQLDCSAVAVPNDGAKLTLTYPGGSIQSGGLTVCTSPAEPERQPVIIDVSPLVADQGDILTITGEGFGTNPNDICAVVINPGKLLPLRVLSVTGTEVRARVGTVPPDALPGPVGLVVGVGRERQPGPIMFGDLEPRQADWSFSARAGGIMSAQMVTLRPPPPDANLRFHSTVVENCALCVIVDTNWPANTRVTVDWHFNLMGAANGITHLDRFLPGVIFEQPGSALECLTRICEEILDEGFRQANLICEVSDLGDGRAKLRVVAADPNACIKEGGVNIVVAPAQRLGPQPQVNNAGPATLQQGGTATINGTGFGTEPDSKCVVLKNGTRLIPMRALTATPNQLTAMLGPVPPGAVPGPIGVACGFFRRGTFVAGFNDLVVGDGGWFFVSPQVGVMAPGNITPVPIPPPSPNTRWYHSLPPSNGVVCLYLSNSCPRNTKIEIDGHFTIGGATNNLRHIDCWMPPIIYKRGGSALDCLRRVCDAFKCAFKQKFGVTLSCSAVPVPGGAKLVLTYPAGMIVNGGVTVCVTPGPGPRIDLVTPTSGEPGEILTIRGAGFGQNPDDVCSVLDDGGGRLIGLNVLSVQDDEIRAALPEIPAFAGGKPHQLKVVIGEGARPRIVPDFDDVQVNENPWTWVGAPQGAAMAVLPVVPRFVPSNQLCLQSPPPSNGVLTLVIDRDWERGQRVCIGARIHKPTDNGSDINFGGITFTGSGTRFDCAVRICDLLKKAFAARGREVNCNVTAQGGNALIRLSCAGVEPLNAGYISVCYKPNLPVVTAVDNPIVFPGDILTVRGRFFPPNPDDLCFVADLRGRLLGLEVLEVQDDPVEGGFIRARVPFIPEFAANQPHQLKIGVGQGVRPHIVPEFGDVVVAAAPWAWAGHPANMVAVNAEIIPRFRPDPLPGFHSLPPSNGVICVVIDQDWGSNMVVCIGARIHKPSDNGHDINFSDVVFTGSGTRFDCAVRICSLLKQTFAARGRLINCHVTAVGENAKITMSCAGPEPLNAGFIDIRIKQPVVPPIIQEVFPLEGGEGDIVTIFGQGFGDVPGNVCAVQRFGDRANPMEVLSVQDDRITARLGFVPPDAFAGEIMVAVGRGVFGRFTPKFDDIIADDDVWVWQRLRPGGVARVPFRPIPTPPLPGVQWFTERLVNGKLETIIEGSWVPGTFVWVQARAHSATVGLDLSAPRCRFVGAGTALQCAERMKDIIACAFLQQAGVNVIVRLQDLGNNRVKIIVCLPPKPDGTPDPIVWGLLRICVTRETDTNSPVITSVSPTSGRQGDLITIRGVNLPDDPAMACDLIVQPNGFIPLEAISASRTQIVARLGPVPPNAVPGRVVEALGTGGFGPFLPRFPDIVPLEPVWVLRRTTEPAATSPANFTPIFTTPPSGTTYYHGFVSNGVLCIFFTNPWPTNALVDIWGGIDDTNRPVHGELRAPQLRFTLGGSIRDCVERIADSLLCPFSQRAGLSLQKEVTVLPGSGVAKLTIRLRGGYIHKGFLIVCVRSARPRPTITSVTPLTVNAGGILTINGSGFGTDTNDQCVVIRNGGQVVPLRSISSTDGQVRAVVGEVPPNFGAGQVMLALGEGSEGGFTPAFPDMTVDAPAWTLQATELGAASQQLVTPIPRNPPQGTRWFFSQPAADGQICLFIVGSFPPCTRFQISGRFQTTGPAKDIDVDVPAFTWSSGGDWLDAAYRLCDGPVCALFQRLGVRIICSVDQAGTNTAKITVRYPEGEIVSGAFTVCAIPGPTKPVPVITEVLPRTAGEGEVITIRGRNFGNNPDNLCVVGRVGDTAVPMRALAATETQILARVGIVLTDLGPTRIMVGRGEGNVGRFTPAFPDIVLEDPSWVWRGFGQAGLDPGQFVAVPSQQRFGVEWFEGRVVDGRLCTYIRGNWAGNTLVQVTARAHTATEGIDADVPRTRFVGAGSTYECALRMKDIIVCAFRQQAQAEVNVEVIQQSDGRVKITVSRADGQAITWGLLTICVSQPVTFPEQFPVHMNINIARPCPPGAGNDLIDKMTDTAGNMVELRCQNGMYILRFIRPNGASKIIGKCVYPWGENAGWKFLDGAGRIQRVVWYNYEGHTGHDSGGPVHDVNGDGRENRDCYIYDVATDTLTVRKDDRGLNPNPQWPGFSHHGLPWDIQRVSNPRPAPTTLAALDLLFADLVGPAVPDGDYDAQTASLQLFGAIRGGGEVVLAINNYPIVVPTTRGMTPAQLAGQVARQFNQRWQQDQTQQGQQRQQQGKHATNDAVYPHIVDIRNALPDEMRVTILGEPELFYNHFAYPDQSVRLQGPATVHKNINIAEPCKPEPGNKLISRMTDASGNAVELRCENGSYHLYFIRPDGTRRAIGQCIYLWGENAGWKHLDERGNFTTVTWYNYEGHHGHDNNQCVHDSNHNPGKENRDCYIYDPATDRLKIRKDCRPLRNCRSDPGKPWQMLSMSPWRPAPEDVTGLHEAFSDFVDPDLPNGDYDAQISGIMFELRPGGRIRGGGRAVVTINDFPILVPTVANMTLTQLVSQVARQFNQQWQQSQTQQGQQQQQQGKSAIYTSSFPAVIDFRNALHEEIVVTLIDEPDVTVKPEVPCGGPLDIQREGDVIIISWEGGGTLQCATNIKGPWTPVTPDPESPYATSANEMMKFYRICCPEDPGR